MPRIDRDLLCDLPPPPPQEGMVHLSQMRQGTKSIAVNQVVKRNQRVFVKVVSVLGDRLRRAGPPCIVSH